jgi:MFS family permease
VVTPVTRGIVQRYFAGLSRTTFLLALASMFADISTEMLYPVLPVFLTQTLHASGSIVGLIDGFAQAAQNIVQGFSGTLSDKLQRRKPIALAGFLLSAISKPLMGFAPSWQVLFGARMLDRLGAGSRSAPRDALIASSVDEENRGRAFGLEGLGDNAGAFFGPLVALFLLYAVHVGIRSVFYLAIIPGLLAFSMVMLVKEQRSAAAKAKVDIRPHRFPTDYWKFLLATALFGLGNSSNAFLILRTQDIDASLPTTIAIYAGYNLVAALISYPAGWLFDKWGGKNALLLCYAIFLIAYLGFAVTQNVVLIAGFFVFYGLYQGIFRTAGKSVASRLVPDRLRASGIGWYSTTLGLLQLVASVIAGLLWDRIGHAAVFYYGAIFAAVGIVALLLLMPGSAERRAPAV